MPSPVLFVHLDNQLLVIRKGEFGQGKYRPFLALSVNRRHIVEGTKPHDNLFLNGGTFCNLFIHHLKSDKVNGEWHVGSVFQFRMEIKQTVVRINPLQDVLDTEALAADMLHQTFVVVIDGLHDQPYQQRGLAAEFRKVDFLRVVRPVHRLAIMDEVFHLDIQLGRLVRILHVECIIAAVIRDHRQIRFTGEVPQRRFHPKHVLRTVRFAGKNVSRSQIHILDSSREDKVYSFIKCHLQGVWRNHPVECHRTCQPVKQITGGRAAPCVLLIRQRRGSRFSGIRRFFRVISRLFHFHGLLCIRTGHTNGKSHH